MFFDKHDATQVKHYFSAVIFNIQHFDYAQRDIFSIQYLMYLYQNYLPFLPSIDNFPGPAKKTTTNAIKYSSAISFFANGSAP